MKRQVETFKILKPVEHQQKPKSVEAIFPKELENNEIKNELNEINIIFNHFKLKNLFFCW